MWTCACVYPELMGWILVLPIFPKNITEWGKIIHGLRDTPPPNPKTEWSSIITFSPFFFVTAYHRSEQYEPLDRIEDEWKHIENVSVRF